MNYILFDDITRENLLPLTFTRPVADIRIGILTIREKWERMLNAELSTRTEEYLQKKYPMEFAIDTDNFWINGSFCPNEKLLEEIKLLQPYHALLSGGVVIAANTGADKNFDIGLSENYTKFESHAKPLHIQNPWDIFSKNGEAIRADFDLVTKGRISLALSATNQVIGLENIFVEEGAKVECAILNASSGPIYIGKEAEVMEGSIIRGPFSLGEHSALKLGAKIYGPTTIGPHSKVGGEVNNSVIFGFSNKAHDGFLGNSVLGEWCNIGADSNNSNLKNNYAEVKLWNYTKERFVGTGLTFCGLIMGDHSKCGINTMFNTGTVVGVNANIFGSGFPRNFVPSFSWGGAAGFTTYKVKDAFEVASRVFERRSLVFDETEQEILTHVFEVTEKYRK
ncbi:MAG TPA: GlmU family protein [Bacteroidia bacterium]|jgi:UDP-N-acetylglucosamine diphosphorylase/glucosamine-1-phosphate N-acetyltransferase